MLRPLAEQSGPPWMLIAALLISCGTHTFIMVVQPVPVGLAGRDSDEYWQIAGNLLSGHGYSFDGERPTRMRQPAYPLFLAAIRALFGDSVTAVLLVQSVLTLVTIILLTGLATHLFGARVGALTALLIAAYAALPLLACRVRTEPLFIAVLSAAVIFWVMALQTKRLTWVVGLGALTGVAALCRPAGLPLLVVLPLALWLQSGGARRMLGMGVVAILAGLTIMAPWGIRNYVVLGEPALVPAHMGTSLWFGTHPMLTSHWPEYLVPILQLEEFKSLNADDYYISTEASKRFAQAARERIRQDPVGVIKRGLWKVAITWSYLPGTRKLAATRPWLFRLARVPQILVLLVAVMGARKSPSSLWSTALVLFLAISAGLLLGAATARHTIPFMPLALLLAAVAFKPWIEQAIANQRPAEGRGSPAINKALRPGGE